jgi:hypothetical protein
MSVSSTSVVFGGGLWPLGWSVGFIERPLSDTLARYRAWMPTASCTELSARPILKGLETLVPFEMPYTRRLLVDTPSGWTAFFVGVRLSTRPGANV